MREQKNDIVDSLLSQKQMKAKYLAVKNKVAFSAPMIDMKKLEAHDKKQLDLLYVSLCNDGFLYVKNHGVPKKVTDDMINNTHQFYRAPLRERLRMKAEHAKIHPGFDQNGHAFQFEVPYNIFEEVNNAIDKDAEKRTKMHRQRFSKVPHQSRTLIVKSQKLDAEETFRIWKAYQTELSALAKRLVYYFELVLGLTNGRLNNFIGGLESIGGSALCYGHTPRGKDGLVAHFDNHFLTILMQDQPGLEARHLGKWYRVDPKPGNGYRTHDSTYKL